jgi:hypothetical protein
MTRLQIFRGLKKSLVDPSVHQLKSTVSPHARAMPESLPALYCKLIEIKGKSQPWRAIAAAGAECVQILAHLHARNLPFSGAQLD